MPKVKYRKRSDGRYETNISIGTYSDDGKLITKHIYAKTVAELEAKAAEIKRELGMQLNIIEQDITYDEYADRWLQSYKAGVSVRTQEMYERIINKQTNHLRGMKLKDVRHTDIQLCITNSAVHPRTAEQIKMTLKQIFSCAVADKIIAASPCEGKLTMPRHIKEEKRALTEDEKDAVRNADFTPKQRAFISLLYGTGMRPAEVYALTWADIDMKAQTVSVNKSLTFRNHNDPEVVFPKTNAGIREIPLPQFVVQALQDWRKECSTIILFASRSGNYALRQPYIDLWLSCKKKIEARLGRPTDLTAYCFRHNFCTELFYSDVSLLAAQKLMGHSDHEMIMRVYSHLDSKREKVAEKIRAIDF